VYYITFFSVGINAKITRTTMKYTDGTFANSLHADSNSLAVPAPIRILLSSGENHIQSGYGNCSGVCENCVVLM